MTASGADHFDSRHWMKSFNSDLRGSRRLHKDLRCIIRGAVIQSAHCRRRLAADPSPWPVFWQTAHQMEANTSGVRLTIRVDLVMPTSRLRLGRSSSFFMLKLIRFIFMPFGIDQHTVYLLFGINVCYMVYRVRWEAVKLQSSSCLQVSLRKTDLLPFVRKLFHIQLGFVCLVSHQYYFIIRLKELAMNNNFTAFINLG